jgi:hypothetical protein
MRCGVVVMMLATVVAGAPERSVAQSEPPADPFEYVVFGLETVSLGARSNVGGPLGANDGEVRVRRRSTIDGVVAADTIRLGRRTRAETVFCTLVIGGGTDGCLPLDTPLVPATALGVVQATPGPGDVDVPRRGQRAPLPEGIYRRLRVGRGSTLTLAGGTYAAESITLGRGASLRCAAPCRVGVRQGVRLGAKASIGPSDGAAASDVRLDVQGEAVKIGVRGGARASVLGTLYAPTSRMRFGRKLNLEGHLVGRSVQIGARARLAPSS